ncbi:5-hydroxyisourate hydrolase [Kwoniella heveanensis CBS 569]|nr:5-hydroxyisourate hydrolase [Kwoniella heveanensis CBS 569]
MSKSPITCHVLDASVGKPAAGVRVTLDLLGETQTTGDQPSSTPRTLASGVTNSDGRCSDLLGPQTRLSPGIYKMTFHSAEYFEALGKETFYPLVESVLLHHVQRELNT